MKNLEALPVSEIKQISLFQGLSENELSGLLQAAHPQKVLAGEFFFFQGDPAERMFVLLEGRVKLSQLGSDGQQALIRINKPVSLFALVAMTSIAGYPVTAQAAVDCRVIYWTRAELIDFVIQIPQLSMNAMRIMAEQLNEIQDRFRQVTTERVELRLAQTLIRLAAQSGKSIPEGILIDLPVTRQDLAEMSGTTQFTVSRLLSQWEEQGLVIAGREKVILRNPQGLANIVEEA